MFFSFFESLYHKQNKSEMISIVTLETFIAFPRPEPINKTILICIFPNLSEYMDMDAIICIALVFWHKNDHVLQDYVKIEPDHISIFPQLGIFHRRHEEW